MTVADPVRRAIVPACGGDEHCRLPAVVAGDAGGKEADPRVFGCAGGLFQCAGNRRARLQRGEFFASRITPLVAVLPTYSPSRAPLKVSYIETLAVRCAKK